MVVLTDSRWYEKRPFSCDPTAAPPIRPTQCSPPPTDSSIETASRRWAWTLCVKRPASRYGGSTGSTSKEALIEAYLRRRNETWRRWLRDTVERRCPDPARPPLAVFDAVHEWCQSDGFRGCALVNASAELGQTTPVARGQAEQHKRAVRAYLTELLSQADQSHAEDLAAQLMIVLDGAIAQAAVAADRRAADRAKTIAEGLLSP